MQEVVDIYLELRSLAQTKNDEVSKAFALKADEEPASFFGMAHNSITVSLELLDHYRVIWADAKTTNCTSVEEAIDQNRQRVILVQKWCFIAIMSSLELIGKGIVLGDPSKFGVIKGRLYLSKIMDLSMKIGILDELTLELWEGAIFLRNSLVHNNGIAESTSQYKYPGVTINLATGNMTQGDLKMFGLLSKWVIQESADWISKAYK